MRQLNLVYFMMLTLIGITALATACAGEERPVGSNASDQPGSGKMRVVTTLYALEYFIGRIGGDSVEVINLVPPGVEAHDFEPRPDDIRQLNSADLIVYNGTGFEPWIDRALESIDESQTLIVETSSGLTDLTSGDPHVWLDPLKAIEQVKPILDGMSRADSDSAEVYAENAGLLVAELEQLDARFQFALAECRLSEFVTSHDAFGYLARRYGLKQVAIAGLSPEAEPLSRDFARLADRIEELEVRYVLVEVIVSVRLAEALAKEVGAQTLVLHPLESLTADESVRGETYFSIMNANLKSLRAALECNN